MTKRKSENDNQQFFLRDKHHAAAELFALRRRWEREKAAEATAAQVDADPEQSNQDPGK